jgi:intein-encoded DNA endonuclease-like protein
VEKQKDSLTSGGKMNPWFITGFADGEGCFLISISRNKELKTG